MGENYVVVVVTHNRLELLKECLMHVEEQTVAALAIIVVDNASEDGTAQFLREKSMHDRYRVLTCTENIGGAGGFERGVRLVLELSAQKTFDCVLLIDDDAMLHRDYMEKILDVRRKYGVYKAFAGTVEEHGVIDVWHRRRRKGRGLQLKNCPASDYEKAWFVCDTASFCGMVLDLDIIKKVGLPCGAYFLWNDDVEYSLRVNHYTRFLIIPSARLDHRKVRMQTIVPHRRYDWREYYGIRNRLLYVRKHGTLLDRMVNRADMFCHIVFRNWLFGMVRMDGYDWLYEQDLVRRAYRDAGKFQDCERYFSGGEQH